MALVRIVHQVNPETLPLDELFERYHEASWYELMRAQLLATEIIKRLNQ